MAYKLPAFPLLCNISQPDLSNEFGIPLEPYRIFDQVCQLTYGRRVQVASTGGTADAGVLVMAMSLLLPPKVDVRGPQDSVAADFVEVPAGTGRWYSVIGVDDIGKGFDNEHRTALIFAIAGSWVAPYE